MQLSGFFHGPDGEKTKEQGKHNVLIGSFQEAVIKSKVKRNLRQQGKEKKPLGVFRSVGGMEKAFH